MSQSTSAKRPTQPESLRLFFGLACPAWATIRQQLQQLRDASQDPCSGLQVVSEASLHITLKFLGSCQAALTSPLIEVLETVGSDSGSFTLKLQGAGSFHGALWLGVDAQPGLTALVQRLEQALLPLGFTVDSKPFRPHLTLARLGHKPQFNTRAWQQQWRDTEWGDLEVSAVSLYQSTHLPIGAQYQVLHSTRLMTG